ncbi:MAG: hypothetical protein US77_C0007G0006 [Microgenomates group bacterium GW2011_GWC1_38_14]|nr:MAG: hypothetical protein US02_C0014G0011 [Candidatus Levybacteria bacterium GW2011_GWA2_36_13]KKQ00389.1 MAG: hypothetical protein US07_C0013G0004 [Candidatus Levybacteria bacterium GW2011_GWB1_36_18]KKQ58164.1 MAG: hypothetical protein US77_C0007G0006 [Microgenomates group bacterium GW2011_GWC1_38_14]KKR15599.1 MAG: hypothetical protein UT44_C0028G0004 [Candidatus Levybacteria bacterium GW2011_GWA1_39_32]
MFIWISLILIALSVVLALISLKKELSKKEIDHAREQLTRDKILFKK